jgi:hypothetical protein
MANRRNKTQVTTGALSECLVTIEQERRQQKRLELSAFDAAW